MSVKDDEIGTLSDVGMARLLTDMGLRALLGAPDAEVTITLRRNFQMMSVDHGESPYATLQSQVDKATAEILAGQPFEFKGDEDARQTACTKCQSSGRTTKGTECTACGGTGYKWVST